MMAEEQRVKRTLTEEAKKRKGESERARSRRTRVNLGLTFSGWELIEEVEGVEQDEGEGESVSSSCKRSTALWLLVYLLMPRSLAGSSRFHLIALFMQ
ncbi:hypothetical protein GBF38_003550 [Nibea albiflora]|uniref:Uncharacterized protein n=1 Tax=Nibea albiflora TaxID=240163 RepID=A0ACB7FL68_NIBAL|nr:hypothetical protein GBF38_003550 [Nibea albiflora]